MKYYIKEIVLLYRDNNVMMIHIPSRKSQALIGHSAEVNRMSFDPHSKFLATGSKDSTARLWDIQTGKQIQIYIGHKKEIWNLDFNSNGDKLTTCSNDNTARIWDVKSGLCIHILNEHKDNVLCSKFDFSGDYCATGSMDSTCKIWDVQTGKCIQTFAGHKYGIRNLSFNTNVTRLVITLKNSTGRVYNVKAGDCVSEIIEGYLVGLYYLQQKNLILAKCRVTYAKIYSEKGELLQTLQNCDGDSFCYSPNYDGVMVACSNKRQNNKLKIWKKI